VALNRRKVDPIDLDPPQVIKKLNRRPESIAKIQQQKEIALFQEQSEKLFVQTEELLAQATEWRKEETKLLMQKNYNSNGEIQARAKELNTKVDNNMTRAEKIYHEAIQIRNKIRRLAKAMEV
jgi:hypothetical protein